MKKKILYIGNKLAAKGATPTSIDTLGPKLAASGFLLRYVGTKTSKAKRLIQMLFAIFKNRNWIDYVLIDTYSTQNFWFAYLSARLCVFFQLKYIPILHGGNLPYRLKSNPKASDFLFKKSYLNVSPSLYLKVFFNSQGYSVIHIPNAIELEKYKFKKRELLRPKLLWVRSFAELYNPLLALKIFESLKQSFPLAELCMVGPAKDASLNECRIYAAKNKLPVTFTGKLSKSEWIALSENYDIFINTSHFDNFPVSIIEAMALGLPVVSTNVGGIPYMIEDKTTGFLVEDNDLVNFVEKIKFLLNNSQKIYEITGNARAQVKDFNWSVVENQWIKILQ
ncbi:glycosyltransferase family 4 protein [Leeuwenhoekiella aequorea]|uniref:Glycosyltransferase involved in cell wall biosynthesis n=1 Tax=Leeuwenhoekiella aequorea TaxID=283736 RepID=A0A4Q0PDV8_9FLAO|nr:glycosyltransferase family 4 protein [Leeuwenhoekiella aequorea]RXG24921.1 glycosyltransferase involved in cell wall biosynthesis [Leeuwenhoekiella aequorea]